MNRERLLILADFLDKLPEDEFDFKTVVNEFDIFGCGAVCCAIGWTPKLFPDQVKWNEQQLSCLIDIHGNQMFDDIAARLFDISQDDAYHLFSPDWQPELGEGFRETRQDAKPKDVAFNVYKFAEGLGI